MRSLVVVMFTSGLHAFTIEALYRCECAMLGQTDLDISSGNRPRRQSHGGNHNKAKPQLPGRTQFPDLRPVNFDCINQPDVAPEFARTSAARGHFFGATTITPKFPDSASGV